MVGVLTLFRFCDGFYVVPFCGSFYIVHFCDSFFVVPFCNDCPFCDGSMTFVPFCDVSPFRDGYTTFVLFCGVFDIVPFCDFAGAARVDEEERAQARGPQQDRLHRHPQEPVYHPQVFGERHRGEGKHTFGLL